MDLCRVIVVCALLAPTSGCQVTRTLKQPIPASAPLGEADERTERIGKVVRDTMRKEGIPGLSIAVIDHGEIVWAQKSEQRTGQDQQLEVAP